MVKLIAIENPSWEYGSMGQIIEAGTYQMEDNSGESFITTITEDEGDNRLAQRTRFRKLASFVKKFIPEGFIENGLDNAIGDDGKFVLGLNKLGKYCLYFISSNLMVSENDFGNNPIEFYKVFNDEEIKDLFKYLKARYDLC